MTKREALQKIVDLQVQYATDEERPTLKQQGMVFGNPEIMKAAGFDLNGCYMSNQILGTFRWPGSKEEPKVKSMVYRFPELEEGDIPVAVPTIGTPDEKGNCIQYITLKGAHKAMALQNIRKDNEYAKHRMFMRAMILKRDKYLRIMAELLEKGKHKGKKFQHYEDQVYYLNEKLEQFARLSGLPVRLDKSEPPPKKVEKPSFFQRILSPIIEPIKKFCKKNKKKVKAIAAAGLSLLFGAIVRRIAPAV